MSDNNVSTIKPSTLAEEARNKVMEENRKKAVDLLVVKYRDLEKAKKVVSNIEREIADAVAESERV